MLVSKFLGIFALAQLSIQFVSANDRRKWAETAQKTIYNAGTIFAQANLGLSSVNEEKSPKLFKLSKVAGK